ncbi:hypothetical protein AMTRI_Chr07g77150 [Amborella trichopoda]
MTIPSTEETELKEAIAGFSLSLERMCDTLRKAPSSITHTLNNHGSKPYTRGATMDISHTPGDHGLGDCRGCINIYVNNTVHGVSSSILLDSKVLMRNAGVCFRGMDITTRKSDGRGIMCEKKCCIKSEKMSCEGWFSGVSLELLSLWVIILLLVCILAVVLKLEHRSYCHV